MTQWKGKVVVVTGGGAGIGRAVADAFARDGARVALLARDPERLGQACRELSQAGAAATLAVPVDMADQQAVEAAAERVEQALGPIDVWVNNAMATVVAPVAQTQPKDFRRVTEVSYLGFVWGTTAALRRMQARGSGSIVQVGSALAYRSIPLQAAYCGAKHAIRGFTESLRTELLHERSPIRLSIVELPGVNTPQFDWCKTSLEYKPQPLGTVYQPEVAARAIVHAAGGGRSEIYVSWSAALMIWAQRAAPGAMDRLIARRSYDGQSSQEPLPPDHASNLWQPVPGDVGAHGRFDARARAHSTSLWINLNRSWLIASAVALAALGWLARDAGREQR
jgi:short-subunit dehydrogenase